MFRLLLPTFIVAAAVTQQCGGASTTTPGTTTTTTPALTFQSITVNAGPANNYFNGAFTTVTVCVPGQSSCQTIGGVLVDTGSSGLRVLASALTLALPQQTDATGASIEECLEFVDGFTWGPVQTADIKLGGEQASGVPMQVIGGPSAPAIPSACASSGTAETTLDTLGANGILGVGLFRQDCGSPCAAVGSSNPGLYYTCPSSGRTITAESLTPQVQNPVWLFPSDNNGVVIQLPSVATGGALAATGMIVFGIGTQTDNALGAAKVLTVDGSGNLSAVYGSRTYGSSYLDSGSNGAFFLDTKTTGLPVCTSGTDFYCPITLQAESATIRGVNGATDAVTFNVGNAEALNGRFSAFSEVAGPSPGTSRGGCRSFSAARSTRPSKGRARPAA